MDREQRVIVLHDRADLHSAAADWNDLWRRSETCLPTARAELLDLWLEHFAPAGEFRALVVRQDNRWVAALPLTATRVKRLFTTGGAPNNPWSPSGELLLDPAADTEAALRGLAKGLTQLPWSWFWFEPVRLGTQRWQGLLKAARELGLPCHAQQQCLVGLVRLQGDWPGYQDRWSKNHRNNMRKALKRADAAGGVRLEVYDRLGASQIEPLLRRGFEVEDHSWKNASGTSVLQSEGMWGFFLRQAELLAVAGHLELVFLEHRGKPIAFEYGMAAKQTYFSPKVGYDAEFSALVPGQLLRLKLIEQFFSQGRETLDFCGPLADATSKWCTHSETVGRLVIGARGPLGRCAAQSYGWLQPRLERFKSRKRKSAEPALLHLGVAPYELVTVAV